MMSVRRTPRRLAALMLLPFVWGQTPSALGVLRAGIEERTEQDLAAQLTGAPATVAIPSAPAPQAGAEEVRVPRAGLRKLWLGGVDEARLIRDIRETLRTIRQAHELGAEDLAVVVAGSYGEGHQTGTSDLDILSVVSNVAQMLAVAPQIRESLQGRNYRVETNGIYGFAWPSVEAALIGQATRTSQQRVVVVYEDRSGVWSRSDTWPTTDFARTDAEPPTQAGAEEGWLEEVRLALDAYQKAILDAEAEQGVRLMGPQEVGGIYTLVARGSPDPSLPAVLAALGAMIEALKQYDWGMGLTSEATNRILVPLQGLYARLSNEHLRNDRKTIPPSSSTDGSASVPAGAEEVADRLRSRVLLYEGDSIGGLSQRIFGVPSRLHRAIFLAVWRDLTSADAWGLTVPPDVSGEATAEAAGRIRQMVLGEWGTSPSTIQAQDPLSSALLADLRDTSQFSDKELAGWINWVYATPGHIVLVVPPSGTAPMLSSQHSRLVLDFRHERGHWYLYQGDAPEVMEAGYGAIRNNDELWTEAQRVLEHAVFYGTPDEFWARLIEPALFGPRSREVAAFVKLLKGREDAQIQAAILQYEKIVESVKDDVERLWRPVVWPALLAKVQPTGMEEGSDLQQNVTAWLSGHKALRAVWDRQVNQMMVDLGLSQPTLELVLQDLRFTYDPGESGEPGVWRRDAILQLAAGAEEIAAAFRAPIRAWVGGFTSPRRAVGVILDAGVSGAAAIAAGLEQANVPVVLVAAEAPQRVALVTLLGPTVPVVGTFEAAARRLTTAGLRELLTYTAVVWGAAQLIADLQAQQLLPPGEPTPLVQAGAEEADLLRQLEQHYL